MHPLHCCTQCPGPGVGWTPTVVRLGTPCRWRLGTPFRIAPTMQVGWSNEAERLRAAPRTEILTRFAVRVSRSRVLVNAIISTFPWSPKVSGCTVNKAIASFRVGELHRQGLLRTPSGWRGQTAKGYALTLKQDRQVFFRSEGRRRQTFAGAAWTQRRRTRRKPLAQSRKQDRLFGYREPRENSRTEEESNRGF